MHGNLQLSGDGLSVQKSQSESVGRRSEDVSNLANFAGIWNALAQYIEGNEEKSKWPWNQNSKSISLHGKIETILPVA